MCLVRRFFAIQQTKKKRDTIPKANHNFPSSQIFSSKMTSFRGGDNELNPTEVLWFLDKRNASCQLKTSAPKWHQA